jgi:hypothetical protein
MTDITFSTEASALCRAILNFGLELKGTAMTLRDVLLRDGVITDEDSYATVMNNVRLKAALLKYLSIGLEQDKNKSRYGRKIVSDFDLYHNMVTDKQFNEVLDAAHFDYNKVDFTKLKKNRSNLRQWLHRLRNNLIEDFELPETPDKDEINRAKKAKKTSQDVEREVAMAFVNSKRIRDDEEIDISDDATINEYGDIGSTHLSDVHGPEFENFAQNNPMVTNEMTVEASALSAPIEACERAEGSDFQVDLSKEVHFLRRLFRDFNRGGTLVMKLNYPEGTDLKAPFLLTEPCSVNVAITKNKAFVKWETTALLDLLPAEPLGI